MSRMARKKHIIFCGYRDWALDIYDAISKNNNVDFTLFTSQEEFDSRLKRDLEAELIFFVGWSWILAEDVINKFFCICLHPSPLPKYRGGSPLQHQIINGEKESAVTLFKMDKGIDKGPILWQESFSLYGDLNKIFKRITNSGIKGINTLINQYLEKGELEGAVQDSSKATYYKRRIPEQSEIKINDFKKHTATELYNKIRALQDPYPNAFVVCKNRTKLYLVRAKTDDRK